MNDDLPIVSILKPLLLFLLYLLLFRVSFNLLITYLGLDGGGGVVVNIFITMAAAGAAMKGQFKRLGRLLVLSEKIEIAVVLVVAGTLYDWVMVLISGKDFGTNVMIVSLFVTGLFHFFGVWLAISTMAEKLFRKELGLA